MNVDITNHLIPWTQVKRMIREAKKEAWAEGYSKGALFGYSPMADDESNPYEVDE